MQTSQQLVHSLKKIRKSETADCLLKREKDTMLSQVNASQNSRLMIDNIHNDFQPFACIMTEKFDNTPKDQTNYYSGKRIKKNVEKRQHKIKSQITDQTSKRQSK